MEHRVERHLAVGRVPPVRDQVADRPVGRIHARGRDRAGVRALHAVAAKHEQRLGREREQGAGRLFGAGDGWFVDTHRP
jgi:hypothetical protein